MPSPASTATSVGSTCPTSPPHRSQPPGSATCPHAYLVRYILGVEPVEEPGDELTIGPLTRGTLVHEVLERFISEQIPDGGRPPWSAEAVSRLQVIGGEVFDDYARRGMTGHRVLSARDRSRLLVDLAEWARRDDGVPIAAEWRFAEAPYALPDGRVLRFRGSVDRIDRLADGSLRITDYKTGGASRYKNMNSADPHDHGTHLQLAVYGAAVAHERGGDVESRYWFASNKGGWRTVGYPFTGDVRASVGEALAAITDGIRRGTFPLRPSEKPAFAWVDCWYCTPDGLSSAEARRAWERKRNDPGLTGYASFSGDASDN
jgi:ATP-dependent helicase/nuclease subunit B